MKKGPSWRNLRRERNYSTRERREEGQRKTAGQSKRQTRIGNDVSSEEGDESERFEEGITKRLTEGEGSVEVPEPEAVAFERRPARVFGADDEAVGRDDMVVQS